MHVYTSAQKIQFFCLFFTGMPDTITNSRIKTEIFSYFSLLTPNRKRYGALVMSLVCCRVISLQVVLWMIAGKSKTCLFIQPKKSVQMYTNSENNEWNPVLTSYPFVWQNRSHSLFLTENLPSHIVSIEKENCKTVEVARKFLQYTISSTLDARINWLKMSNRTRITYYYHSPRQIVELTGLDICHQLYPRTD